MAAILVMEIRFLVEPALLADGTLVVADLHLGIEAELAKSGVNIPSQMPSVQKRIENLIGSTKAKHLVILGDVKHNVPGFSWNERKELPGFLAALASKARLSIVKGNHDGGIEALAPEGVKVYGPGGFRLGDIGFVHGHAWPSPRLLSCRTLVIAHSHPSVEFFSSGARVTEHVWLRCPVDSKVMEGHYGRPCGIEEAIIMPAFNPLSGGSAFNSEGFRPIGPLLANSAVAWRESKVYLLDGTYLGALEKLKSREGKD
ncbi:MAG: metallophosphoesterase [Candidatus Aenigmatarchaeota archaeon]